MEAEYARLAADPAAWAAYRWEAAEWEAARAPVAGRPRPGGGLYASGDPSLSQQVDDALRGFGTD